MTEKYVGSDKLYVAGAGTFANLGEALKQVYSVGALDGMINAESPFRKALGRDPVGENFGIQIAALLGETDFDPEMLEWLADFLERKQVAPKQIAAWRGGTLAEHEAKRANRRQANRRSVFPLQTDHPPTRRTARQAQQPRGRPRLRARSSTQPR